MGLVDSMKKLIFVPTDDEEEEEVAAPKEEKRERPARTPVNEDFSAPGVRKGKVVTLNSGSTPEIALLKLDTFQGTKAIIDHMKQRIPVVFNLARLDHSEAVRVVDSVYGATYALDGTMEKASNEIFIVTPNGTKITGDVKDRILGSNDFSMDI